MLVKNALDDLGLVNEAKKGNEKAFSTLLNKYKSNVYYIVLKQLNNETIAEDLSIEIFSKAFSNLNSYSDNYPFSTWLFKIATNHCIDYIRRCKNGVTLINHDNEQLNQLVGNIQSDDLNPEEIIIDEQYTSIIKNKINQLKPNHRQLLELRYFKEYSYEEIAKELGIPIGTVKARLYRAKKSLYSLIK